MIKNQRPNTKNKDLKCLSCHRLIPINRTTMGTRHRNHCPFCLWSKHVDTQSGDRRSSCQGAMEPIGFTFKSEGTNRYTGLPQAGELMVTHRCLTCQTLSCNRLAADDEPKTILQVFETSFNLDPQAHKQLAENGITLLTEKDRPEILKQLYGRHLP